MLFFSILTSFSYFQNRYCSSTLPFSYSTNFLSQEPSNTNGKIHAIAIFLIVFGFHFVTYW